MALRAKIKATFILKMILYKKLRMILSQMIRNLPPMNSNILNNTIKNCLKYMNLKMIPMTV